jgi:hypothetical protein
MNCAPTYAASTTKFVSMAGALCAVVFILGYGTRGSSRLSTNVVEEEMDSLRRDT